MMSVNPNDQERRDWVLATLTEYEWRLTRYAVRLVGDEDLARDAVQHAFLKMCDAEREDIDGHLVAWLYTVCRNKALDMMREAVRVGPLNGKESGKLAGREADPAVAAEATDLSAWVNQLLDDLPGGQREVIDLVLEGLPYASIAEIIGRSAGHTRVIAHRAIASLRKHPRVRELLQSESGDTIQAPNTKQRASS